MSQESVIWKRAKPENLKVTKNSSWVLTARRFFFTVHSHDCFHHLGLEYPSSMLATSVGNLFHCLLSCLVKEHLQITCAKMWIEQKGLWSCIFKRKVVWGFNLEDNTVYLFIFLNIVVVPGALLDILSITVLPLNILTLWHF